MGVVAITLGASSQPRGPVALTNRATNPFPKHAFCGAHYMFVPSPSLVRIAIVLAAGFLPSIVAGAQMRTWIDSTGKHHVEAELVTFKDGIVTLRNSAGKNVTLPITRLSENDQAFVQQQFASSNKDSQKTSPAVGKPATAKPVAKRFYYALIDQNFDELKTLLTPAAQSNWDAAKTQLEGLDAPDGRQAVLVRTATEKEGIAEVNVSIKVRGKFKKQHLQLRWSSNQWLVASLIPDEEDESPVNFEGSGEGTSRIGEERIAQRGEDDDDTEAEAENAEEGQATKSDAKDAGDDDSDNKLSDTRVPRIRSVAYFS